LEWESLGPDICLPKEPLTWQQCGALAGGIWMRCGSKARFPYRNPRGAHSWIPPSTAAAAFNHRDGHTSSPFCAGYFWSWWSQPECAGQCKAWVCAVSQQDSHPEFGHRVPVLTIRTKHPKSLAGSPVLVRRPHCGITVWKNLAAPENDIRFSFFKQIKLKTKV
jgi:hypothetical protein